jgi:hypothetical protein
MMREEVGNLPIRFDRIVLTGQYNCVIERQTSTEDLLNSFQRRPNMAEAAVVAAMTVKEVDVLQRTQGGGDAVEHGVVSLLVDVDQEVGAVGIEPRDQSRQLLGQLYADTM